MKLTSYPAQSLCVMVSPEPTPSVVRETELTPVGNVHFIRKGNIVLVPQPENDEHDPLNWSYPWKVAIMVGAMLVGFCHQAGPFAVGSTVPYYVKAFDRPEDDILEFTGYFILLLGFSALFWVPLSSKFGRRPVLLSSTVVGAGIAVWRAVATSYESTLGAACMHGFASGASQTIPAQLIADVMFLHERGLWMGTFTGFMFGGLTIGPVIAGVMADRYGWRSFWWFDLAVYVFLFVYLLFFVPETKWERKVAPAHIARVIEANDGTSIHEEKVIMDQQHNEFATGETTPTIEEPVDNFVGRGRPSKGQYALWHFYGVGIKALLQPFTIPVRLCAFPIIIWMSFAFSGVSCNFLISNLTQSAAFSVEPYNMSSASVGYMNFASFIGMVIGMLTAGPLSDWWCQWQTKKNNGIREPEMRLPVMIPFFVIQLIGFVCISQGMQDKWPWEAIVIVGFTFTGIQVAALANIICTYAVDCYRPVAGDILLLGSLVKDLWAYGVSKWLPAYFMKSGFITPLWVCYTVTLVPLALTIPLYFFGKTFRRWSRNSSIHDL